MPKISVIIPIYKVEKYLRQCVDSVINQTLRDIEIILIDDESPDGCPGICDEYAASDRRVRVVHQKNRGIGGARNAGLQIAGGKYIFFLDSDDWLDTDGLRILYERAEQSGAHIVLTGETLYMENYGKFVPGWRDYSKKTDIENLCAENFFDTFTPAWARLYRTEFIRDNNLRFVERCWFEDNSWGAFIFMLADKVAFTPSVIFYRQRDDSVTNSLDSRVFDIVKDFEFFMNFVHEHNISNNDKIKLVHIWYLRIFYDYLLKLNKHNQRTFYNHIKNISNQINLSVDAMKEMNIHKTVRKKLVRFHDAICNLGYDEYDLYRKITIFGLVLLTVDAK